MDALRLIVAIRGALARSDAPPDVLAEAWQAQALARTMAARLAVSGPPELRDEALDLSEVSGRGCALLGTPPLPPDRIRATHLTSIADPRACLVALGTLLGEVGIALVGVACAVDGEADYWQCIEAIDAADDSRDRVLEMLRRLGGQGLGREVAGR
ncbi:hypothetical protein H9Y04_11450 [Streptomyces sp. TRM66268-LWL]|uniref:Uncharacterized protein n=1 Tax=Streptomyces polyasparticus TaxID=2767826 RepID=A0ABR7SFD9_9ACTN|nr:DUF6099 family protein [Streptomyces polyasparticus]MBC9713186.1 hypothetical protein [Streptomyces polyasparticus]